MQKTVGVAVSYSSVDKFSYSSVDKESIHCIKMYLARGKGVFGLAMTINPIFENQEKVFILVYPRILTLIFKIPDVFPFRTFTF